MTGIEEALSLRRAESTEFGNDDRGRQQLTVLRMRRWRQWS